MDIDDDLKQKVADLYFQNRSLQEICDILECPLDKVDYIICSLIASDIVEDPDTY